MLRLVRVDHRLLHGQVAFKWTRSLGTDCILIANDGVAKDELRMSALKMAKPEGIKMVIKSIEDSAAALNSGVTDKYKLMVIVETIEDAYRLCEKVPAIMKVNLGGARVGEGKRQISMAMFVSRQDCERLREMDAKGIALEIQMVPNDVPQNAMNCI